MSCGHAHARNWECFTDEAQSHEGPGGSVWARSDQASQLGNRLKTFRLIKLDILLNYNEHLLSILLGLVGDVFLPGTGVVAGLPFQHGADTGILPTWLVSLMGSAEVRQHWPGKRPARPGTTAASQPAGPPPLMAQRDKPESIGV